MTVENLCSEIHADLVNLLQKIFKPLSLRMTNLCRDAESRDYAACFFKLNSINIVFRAAHVTPTKVGQFVTLWKRQKGKTIQPYDDNDPVDFFVVNVRNKKQWGQFVFSKQVLAQRGIISRNGDGGKRAFRLYPAWDVTNNPQARSSQIWQGCYFIDLSDENTIDWVRAKDLYAACFANI